MRYIPSASEYLLLKRAMDAYMIKHNLGAKVYKAISGQTLLVPDLDRYAYLLWTQAYAECVRESRPFCYKDD